LTVRSLGALTIVAWLLWGCTSSAPGSAAVQGLPTAPPPQRACAAHPDPSATDRGHLCIVILGDSIGVGVPLEGDDRWWVRMRAALTAALPDRHVVVDDWAVSGSRVDVLEAVARDQSALDSYDIAIVIEGVNDQPVSTIADWQPRYGAAVAAIERRGPIVIVTTPPPGFEDGAFITRYDATAAAIREVAGDHRPLLDLATRWRADGPTVAAAYYVDIIHQSAAGQAVMAEMAGKVVLDALGGH
jgi:lysophospholipase L1-like esterase